MATHNGNNGPTAFLGLCDKMQAGTTKNIMGKSTVTVKKVAMTAAQINAKLATGDTLYSAVRAARSALKLALVAWTAAEPGLRAFVKAYTASLKGLFGEDNPELEDFGLVVKVRATPSVETKVLALAAARETRAARGPTSKKARAAITTAGKPGLVLVSPSGVPIPGPLSGPTPPGSGTPAAVNLVPGGIGSSPASVPESTPSSDTPGR
jgi:hypothetical protein